MKKVYLRLLLTNIFPVIYCLIGALTWLIIYIVKKFPIKGNQELKDRVLVTFIIIGFSQYVTLLSENFKIFNCQNLYRSDNTAYFLTGEYDLKCWTEQHSLWAFLLAFPMLILLGVVFPLVSYKKIKQNKNSIQNECKMIKRYSFLYCGYKSNYYFQEWITFAKKVLLILALTITALDSSVLQIYFTLYINSSSLFTHLVKRPFTSERNNQIEALSQATTVFVNLLGLYYATVDYIEGLEQLLSAIGTITILLFLLRWLYEFIKIRREIKNYKGKINPILKLLEAGASEQVPFQLKN